MRLLLCTRHGALGSSSRLRLMAYRPWLEQIGFRVTISPLFVDADLRRLYRGGRRGRAQDVLRAYGRRLYVALGIRSYQLLWIEKELFPFLPAGMDGLLRRIGVPYALDYDDATFHRYDQHASPLVRWLLGRRLIPLLQGARLVTVGNDYLAEYARAAGALDVREVPTVVDTRHYAVSRESADGEVRIGWIGSPSTAQYLDMVREPLRRLAQQRPLRFIVIGAREIPAMGVPLELHDWSADTEAALLATVHMGIMPLRDGPWERGKCGYKLIQYMACGKPVIASPVGANIGLVTPAVGLLAADEEQWLTALRTLAADARLRQRLGHAGRALVERHYALPAWGPRVAAWLRAAADPQS